MSNKKFNLLAKKLKAELYLDPIQLEIYATSACLYRIPPKAVVVPREAKDLVMVMEFSQTEKIPITARGAGSGVAGQAIGQGIIIDFTRYFNQLKILPEEKAVWVEPGVIYAELNQKLSDYGLFFPPDPSSGNYCTIGGMIANNSSGAHSLFYGSTQNYVEELEVILADGSYARLGKNKFELIEEKTDWAKKIPEQLKTLLERYQTGLAKDRPRVKNSSGYLLWGAIEPDGINYARLLAGSEGTLALILRAKLSLQEIPRSRSAGLLYFRDLVSATNAVLKLRELNPLAIEIMDKNFIKLVKEHSPDLRSLLDDSAEVMLLYEFSAENLSQAQEKINSAHNLVIEKERLGYKSVIAQNQAEANKLWQMRQSASPILYRLGSGLVRFIEDIVIPPERLPEGMNELQKLFSEFNTFAPILGHAGEGNLHLNPQFNPQDKEHQRKMQILAQQVYKIVIELGGSISGEHGDGILRAPYVQMQFPNAYPAFQKLKKIFDPEEILNPGKILSEPGLIPMENIKYWLPESIQSKIQKSLEEHKLFPLIFRCHGCGLCRSYCPAYLGFNSELALPRSKISIARALAQNLTPENEIKPKELKNFLNTCYSCNRCLSLCPTLVEVPRILEPIREYQLQKEGFSLRGKLLERSGEIIGISAKIPSFISQLYSPALLSSSLKSIGINPKASAIFTRDDYKKMKKAKIWQKPHKAKTSAQLKIIYFPGCLEQWLEPEIFEHTQALLANLGAEVQVIDDACCGIPALSLGNLEKALKSAKKISEIIIPLIDQGYKLLTNCPSCYTAFHYHYPIFLGKDGEKIAQSAMTTIELLAEMKNKIEPKQRPVSIIYHRACHIIALGEPDPILKFLKSFPNIKLSAVIEQCCGAGGSFELKLENQSASEKISQALKEKLEKFNNPIVVSACGLCRRKIRTMGFDPISTITLL